MKLNDDDRLAAITPEQTKLKDQQSDSGPSRHPGMASMDAAAIHR
jgi:hypothetical protein